MKMKRMWNRKVVLAAVLILLLQLTAFIINQTGSSGVYETEKQTEQYNQLVVQFQDMPLEDALAQIQDMQKGENNTTYNEISKKIKYLISYPEQIQTILNNAKKAEAFSIFKKQGGFAYNNIIKTAADFQKMSDVKPVLDHDQATQHLLEYTFLPYFIIVFMLYVIYELLEESQNGMQSMTFTMKNGRGIFALKSAVCLSFIAIIYYAINFVCNLLASCLLYGIDNFGGAIQTISEYQEYSQVCSKGMYLFGFGIRSAFAVVVMVSFLYFIFILLNNRILSVVTILGIYYIEWRLYSTISIQSNLKLFRYMNLFSLCSIDAFDQDYRNLNINNQPVSASLMLLIVEMLVCVLCMIIAVVIYHKRHPRMSGTIFTKIFAPLEKQKQRILFLMPFVMKEIYKLFISKKKLVFLCIIVLLSLWITNKTIVKFPDRQVEMNEIYQNFGGSDWNGFDDHVTDMENEHQQLMDESSEIKDQISKGELSSDNILSAESLDGQARNIFKELDEFHAKQQLRDSQADVGISIYAMADRGYDEIIGSNALLREMIMGFSMIMLLVVITVQSFDIEKRSGMKILFTSATKGKAWIWRIKVILLLLYFVVVFAALYSAVYYMLVKQYSSIYIEAPVQSLTFLSSITEHISIFQYIVLEMIMKFMIFYGGIGTTIYLASKHNITNQMYVPFLIAVFWVLYFLFLSVFSFHMQIVVSTMIFIIATVGVIVSYRNWKFR